MIGKISKLFRGRSLWYLAAFLVIAVITTYIIEPYILGETPDENQWHPIFVATRNFVFLGIVGIIVWRFGFIPGSVALLVIALISLPHVIEETIVEGYHPSVLTEYAVIIPVGVVLAWLIGTLRQAENKLQDSEKRYRRLFETAQDAILILDGNSGKIIDANPFVKDLLGYNQEELVGKNLWEIGEIKDTLAGKISYQELSESGYKRWDDLPLVTRDGRKISVEVVANAYQVDHMRVIQCNIRDMTVAVLATEALKTLNEDLKVAQRLTKIGNWKWVIATNQVTWSDELCRIHGWAPEVPVPPFAEMERFYTPEGWKQLNEAMTNALNAGESYELELTQIRTDGTKIITFSRGEADFDANGKIVSLHGTVQDITERKQAERRIEHLNSVLKAVRNVNQLITRENDRQHLIQQSCELLIEGRLYGQAWLVLLDENRNFLSAVCAGLGESTDTFLEQLKTGDLPNCVKEQLSLREPLLPYQTSKEQCGGCAIFKNEGLAFSCKLVHNEKLYGILGVTPGTEVVFDNEEQDLFLELCGDVAFALAKIEQEEKLSVVEGRYQTVVQTSIDGFWLMDAQGYFLDVNDSYSRLIGYSREELLKMRISDIEVSESPEETAAHFAKKIKLGGDHFETKHRRRDGRVIDVDVSVTYLISSGLFCVFLRDITEHKTTEEELVRLRQAVEASGEAVFLTDREGVITYINPEFTKLYGYSAAEVVGKTTPRILKGGNTKPEEYAAFWNELICKRVVKGELVNKTKDGRLITVEGSANPILNVQGNIIGFLAIQRDITERKKLQQQVMAQDRLASIGQLVSGVAHEINNPLTGVIGFSELLLKRKDMPDDAKEDLKVINGEAMRASMIIKNLLTFARRQPEGKAMVKIHTQIQSVLVLRKHEQEVNNIQVITRFASDLPQVKGNASQLQQVFFNIIINAEFFMLEAHQKGNLTITTEHTGDFVRASFSDDGPGISLENMNKLFAPFFTTKEVGKGTGLGLSICHGIVTEHGGRIYAESELGKGATFIVELPVKKTTTSRKVAK